MTDAPEPVFTEPWHAQIFALTVYLNEAGHVTWTDWAARFGATLKRHGLERELDGGDDSFKAWLEALETFLNERAMADTAAVEDLRAAWKRAYLTTAHGDPVTLDDVVEP